jgi:hypothetical protein
MKRILFIASTVLLGALLLMGCSSDSASNNKSAPTINPPSWILGSWLNTDSKSAEYQNGFKFDNHDLSKLFMVTSSVSYAGVIQTYNAQWPATVTEEKTDTYYKITIKYADKNYQYYFVKKPNNQIQEMLADPNGVTLYTKQ